MRRRQFLSWFLGGAVGALPCAARGDAPEQVKALSDEVDRLRRTLAAADRHREQILYLVHTMRSPLNCVHLRTEVMRDETRHDLSDQTCRDLQMSVQSCGALADLINEVFALEKSWRQTQA